MLLSVRFFTIRVVPSYPPTFLIVEINFTSIRGSVEKVCSNRLFSELYNWPKDRDRDKQNKLVKAYFLIRTVLSGEITGFGKSIVESLVKVFCSVPHK